VARKSARYRVHVLGCAPDVRVSFGLRRVADKRRSIAKRSGVSVNSMHCSGEILIFPERNSKCEHCVE
jgi:hypothetical protein